MWTCSVRICKGFLHLHHHNVRALRSVNRCNFSNIAVTQNNNPPPSRSPAIRSGIDDFDLEDLREIDDTEEIWSAAPGYIPTFNFAAYANESELIKQFVHLGVKIYKWEKLPKVPEMIMKLDFQKDVGPRIRFLVDNGLSPDSLAYFFTENPHIFEFEIENLQKRVDYLKSKKFTPKNIAQIIESCPTWLNFSVEDIDRKLGFFQKTFHLTGDSVRKLATTGPQTVIEPSSQIKNINLKVKEEMGFEPDEIRTLLLTCPKIWNVEPYTLWRRFDQLHNDFKFTHAEMVRSPELLLSREGRMKERVYFLRLLGRAQFNPEKPNYVSASNLVDDDDSEFAVRVAKSSIQAFNKFLKTL